MEQKIKIKFQKIIWPARCAGIVLFTVFCLFSGCAQQQDYSQEMKSIKDKFEGIEKRLAKYEQQGELKEKELKTKLDEYKVVIEEQLKKLAEKATAKPEKIEPVKPPQQEKPAIEKKTNSIAKQQYHVVSRGETLYSVSKKYGVSVAELRRLNHLKDNQNIQTGQKLLISNNNKH